MENNNKTGMGLQIASAAAPIIGQGLGMLFSGWQDRRQLKQQEKLNNLAVKSQKEMADYQQAQQLDIWNKTNYEAQVKHMKDAGLSVGLMYGGGGGGGTTGAAIGSGASAASAADAASTQQVNNGMGMMAAQIANLAAQTEKTKAETAKITGVDTEESRSRMGQQQSQTELNNFQNAVNEMIGADMKHKEWATEYAMKGIENSKMMAEWNALKAGGFKNADRYDSEYSPIAKALRAGYEKTVQDLKNAQAEGDLKKAEIAIKGFEARMANQGIPKDTPWYATMLSSALEEMGVNPKITQGIIGGIGSVGRAGKGAKELFKKTPNKK